LAAGFGTLFAGLGSLPVRVANPSREASRARLGAIGNEDQMNVIGHQATGPDSDAMLEALLAEIAVEFIVRVREEHGFAPISALR
jgi:hypothetical protein